MDQVSSGLSKSQRFYRHGGAKKGSPPFRTPKNPAWDRVKVLHFAQFLHDFSIFLYLYFCHWSSELPFLIFGSRLETCLKVQPGSQVLPLVIITFFQNIFIIYIFIYLFIIYNGFVFELFVADRVQ